MGHLEDETHSVQANLQLLSSKKIAGHVQEVGKRLERGCLDQLEQVNEARSKASALLGRAAPSFVLQDIASKMKSMACKA